jgi:curved DNA-binding protein CbpA
MTDLYTALGVRPGANQIEIREGYRRAMRAAHPDHATGEADRARRTVRSAAINGAYERLGDPERRAAYDLQRAAEPTVATETPVSHAAPTERPHTATRGVARPLRTFRLTRTDLFLFPGSFLGYVALPILAPGTLALAGAAYGALFAVVVARLAVGDGQLRSFVDRLRHR